MKTLHRGSPDGQTDQDREFPPQEVKILPFGLKYYRDRFSDGQGDVTTPKSALGGTTVMGDRTFQRGK